MDGQPERDDQGTREKGGMAEETIKPDAGNADVSDGEDTAERVSTNDTSTEEEAPGLGIDFNEETGSTEILTEQFGASRGSILGGRIRPIGRRRQSLQDRFKALVEERTEG